MDGILERVRGLCVKLPANAQLGFHLCYGDLFHKHFLERVDTSLLVEVANALVEGIGPLHPVVWIYIPVLKAKTNEAYFAPSKGLPLEQTTLFLGLVHANDEAGTKEWIRAARSGCPCKFGVAMECGMGRTPIEELDSILTICRNVTKPRGQLRS